MSFWTTLLDWPGWLLLVGIRLLAAQYSPIMDCDETFNYWEPLHYLLRHTGLQTWEYAPQYALRSWVYIEMHAVPLRLLPSSFAETPGASFFVLRQLLALLCATCEISFCRAAAGAFGHRVGGLLLLFSGLSSGMFHSGVALLPSTTCMYCVMIGYTCWLNGRVKLGLAAGCFGVLLVWPIVAPMFIPMGMHALVTIGIGPVGLVALLGGVTCFVLPALVDGYFYYGAGKPVSAVGNFIMYNVVGSNSGGGGEGADLYGVEPWTFYPANLVLNFNMVAVVGLVGPVLLLAWGGPKKGLMLMYLAGMYLAFGLFQTMAHKEERFLSMIYPILSLSSALVIDACLKQWTEQPDDNAKHPTGVRATITLLLRAATFIAVCAFALLSAGRTAALVRNFNAPFSVYSALPPNAANVCVGKEWYRFPSSFFLPSGSGSLLWLRGGFGGQLPQPYGEWPQGLSDTPLHMNDRNQDEASRYVHLDACDYVVDLDLDGQAEASVVQDTAVWQKVHCSSFLDSSRSPALSRALHIPGISEKRNKYADYCLMKRKVPRV